MRGFEIDIRQHGVGNRARLTGFTKRLASSIRKATLLRISQRATVGRDLIVIAHHQGVLLGRGYLRDRPCRRNVRCI